MSLNCDILFAYANRREYVGNFFNYRNVTTLQVERVFDATRELGGPAQNVPPLRTGAYTGVIVNGIDFGTGRIVSFSNPVSTELTENACNLWKQIVNVEVSESGYIGNIGSNNAMVGLATVYHDQLTELNETFSFDLSPQGDYQYAHAANAKCINEVTGLNRSGFILAKEVISVLAAAKPNFGYIDVIHSGYFTSIGRRTYSETYDTINGTAAFDEKFVIQNRDFVKHTVAFTNGFVTITESAIIRHSGVSSAHDVFTLNPNNITTRYNSVYDQAYTRCSGLWNTYASVLGTDYYTSYLSRQPAQLTRAFDEKSQELTYTLVYTNNPNMTEGGYSIDREQTYSENTLGIIDVTEAGTVTWYSSKNTSLQTSLNTALNTEIAGAFNRLLSNWTNLNTCKLVNDSKNLTSRGKKAAYSVTYTNDPSFIDDGVYLTKNVVVTDSLPLRMHTPYLVLGRKTPLMHNPGQTQFGTASCTISVTWPRTADFRADEPEKPTVTLNRMFSDSINAVLARITSKTPLDMYVSKVSYNYSSDLRAELTTEAQYVYARTSSM